MKNIQVVDLTRYTPSTVYFDDDVERWSIPMELVKILIGGEWPDPDDEGVHGFHFDAVDRFLVEKDDDGCPLLVPDDGFGGPCPGPDFRITLVPMF